MFGGEATTFRGRDECRDFFRDLDEAFAEFQVEISEIRDLGERLVTIGHLRGRGRTSGAEVESPIGYVIDFKNGKAVRYRDYFDPDEALEAARLRE
jgi:ketosteroid isomerase-like protein